LTVGREMLATTTTSSIVFMEESLRLEVADPKAILVKVPSQPGHRQRGSTVVRLSYRRRSPDGALPRR
jgi:hypothetical protein